MPLSLITIGVTYDLPSRVSDNDEKMPTVVLHLPLLDAKYGVSDEESLSFQIRHQGK